MGLLAFFVLIYHIYIVIQLKHTRLTKDSAIKSLMSRRNKAA